jgi:hypothetical protein
MFLRFVTVAMLALSLLATAGSAQTDAELLQKGIYTQETAGDLDAAIQIYRQVISTAGSQSAVAAQAQYQLVVCMLRKNDREAADKELQFLAQYFGNQPDLVSKALAQLQGSRTLLPAPWGEREASQLNIKRDGAFTGEYLFYTVDPGLSASSNTPPDPQVLTLGWELMTKKTYRRLWITADRGTMMSTRPPGMESNDDLGDPATAPFKGPAIDDEVSVFLLRRLPLAVGYTTKLPVTSEQLAPVQTDLKVTGIESVQVPGGKFNCFRVAFGPAGQTFWIGTDRSRPLVKFQSGNVEAELARTWGAEKTLETALAFLRTAGSKVSFETTTNPFNRDSAYVSSSFFSVVFRLRRAYTPSAEIPQALRQALADELSEYQRTSAFSYTVRPGSVQERLIGGQQALTCVLDFTDKDGNRKSGYRAWIQTESTLLKVTTEIPRGSEMDSSRLGVFRWRFEPLLERIRIP